MTDSNPLARLRHQHLTLDDLVDVAGRLLRQLDVRSDDGRVTAVPDDRGVRYYQTLGLVDKPLRYDGRRAIYGYRHLLQLLAVKQLQQEGNPLHLIQQTLAGRPTEALERGLETMLADPAASPDEGPGTGRAQVVTSPRPAAPPAGTPPEPHPAASTQPSVGPASRRSSASRQSLFDDAALVATRLAPGVTLVVDPEIVGDPATLINALTDFLHARRKEH